MRMSLNPDDLAVESAVVGPEAEDEPVTADPWYTNTQPIPPSNTGCTACWAVNQA